MAIKYVLVACAALAYPSQSLAWVDTSECDNWQQADDRTYCATFLQWLPQFSDDFTLRDTEGRYALDCTAPGGIELSGTGEGEDLTLIVDGATMDGAEVWLSYYGNQSTPVTFVYGLWPDQMPHGLTVNGDQGGFYILEDTEGGRRLGQCAD